MTAEEFKTRFLIQQPDSLAGVPARGNERQAAVLIPLWQRPDKADGELELILTQRAGHLNAHPGQISFPGGKQDETDASMTATALREASEEIALPSSQVNILGQLPVHNTITGFAITPVVGLVTGPFTPTLDPGEVADCFSVPWSFLLDPVNRHLKTFKRRGKSMEICFIPWRDKFIWGATAAMIDQLCNQLGAAHPALK
ncbi:CoA pyrophosphatase [Shewanella corallii]|uniref:CoA pyrophosphatase n=1 Tax=Shewanella corallii TaxID=560080 RepID=UPI003204D047